MDDRPKPTPFQLKPASETSGESVKETIESILIAFILAFVFRAFVVEAFVIPTGSMAPTLLGAGICAFRCQDCGYQFDVNYGNAHSHDEPDVPKFSNAILSMHCPNCGHKVPREDARDPAQAAYNTPVYYGDRILVLKYLYLLEEPRRWDVVVFKSPYVRDQPARDWYTINYIKRLVGKPGESIMVLDGDVYVGQKDNGREMKWEIQRKPRRCRMRCGESSTTTIITLRQKTGISPGSRRKKAAGKMTTSASSPSTTCPATAPSSSTRTQTPPDHGSRSPTAWPTTKR